MARTTRASGGAPGLALWLGLAAIVILLDQLTKTLILGDFRLGDSRTVTSFFDVVRAHNTGAAFSFLAGASGWQRWFFVGLGSAASVFIRAKRKQARNPTPSKKWPPRRFRKVVVVGLFGEAEAFF